MSKLTEEEKDRQVEVEIQTAKQIANKLYQVVSNKEFIKEVPDGATRHKVVMMQLKEMDKQSGARMYESFGSAYPVVLKYMTQRLSYSEAAFEKFLRKQAQDPGKGMEGFIEHQANYVKYLYLESCKTAHKHPNMKEANKLRNDEFTLLNSVRKDLELSKKKAENEFEEESVHHLSEKRKELLAFVNSELTGGAAEYLPDVDEEAETVAPTLMTDEEYFNSLSRKDQKARLDTLYFLERTHIKELDDKDKEIRACEKSQAVSEAKRQESFLPPPRPNNRKVKRR